MISVTTARTAPSLDVFIDHTCPYSYMAFTAVRRVVEPGDGVPAAAVRWRPLPVAGSTGDETPAVAAMRAARQAASWPEVAALAERSFGLGLVEPAWEVAVDPRPAARVAKWVEAHAADRTAAFHAAVFRGRFEVGLDIADPIALDDLARSAGIAALGSIAMWLAGDDTCASALAEDAALAEANGITAVPAILVDGRHLLLGAQSEAVIRATLGEIASVPAMSTPTTETIG